MVVVEVRRQAGCSFHFRDAAKAILRSSKGLGKQRSGLRSAPVKKFCIPPMLPKRSREEYHECIRDDFRVACNMLHSTTADSHLLALESMGKMTTTSDSRDVASKLVLRNYDCIKKLLNLLDLYTKEQRYGSTHCRKILEVLANSFEAISISDLAEILSTNNHDLKARTFVSFLISSLEEASTRPHDAFQAARCMRCLLVSKEVESLLVEMSAMDAISSARSVGLNCHEQLEQESFKLLGQLQNVC
jgi:DNA-binding transcriptional ArsR family regulator